MASRSIHCQKCEGGLVRIRTCKRCGGDGVSWVLRSIIDADGKRCNDIDGEACPDCEGRGLTLRCDACGTDYTVVPREHEATA